MTVTTSCFAAGLIRMDPPAPLHVTISQFLVYQWQQYLVSQNLSLVVRTETGVRTETSSSRIPDVTICTQALWEKLSNRPGGGILDFAQEEMPRLVVEVVSSNWREDYLRKRAEYAIIQVPEYWIVDYVRQQVWGVDQS